jgi:hypothetical protein
MGYPNPHNVSNPHSGNSHSLTDAGDPHCGKFFNDDSYDNSNSTAKPCLPQMPMMLIPGEKHENI